MDLFRLLVLIPVTVLFGIVGLALLFTPAKNILRWDRMTGYWLAQRAKSSNRGVLLAGALYKILGTALLAVVLFELLPGILR